MKVGVEGFEVKDTNGKPWLRVERKGMARWNERIISNMEGIPVCSIERDPKVGASKMMCRWFLIWIDVYTRNY